MLCNDTAVEGEDGRGILRHIVVRPGCEVELCHLQRPLRATSKLYNLCMCVYCVCEKIVHQLYKSGDSSL